MSKNMGNVSDANKYPSMDITYEWGRQAPEQLAREASSLDTKTMGIFASASIIIGLIATRGSVIRPDLTIIPLAISVLCFLTIFAMSIWSLWGRNFLIADDPQILKEDYWGMKTHAAKEQYWEYTIAAFKMNYQAVIRKGIVLKWLIPLLAGEVSFLLIWLFLTSFTMCSRFPVS
ncbi:MAG: hypothetical protein WCA51_06170 [Dehalococcoidia bacterium]